PLGHGDAPSLHSERAPGPRPRRDAERHGVAQGRHGDGGAQRSLGVGDRYGDREVAALAAEQLVAAHPDDHIEVARRAAVETDAAFALEADALAVVDAGRYPHLDLPGA